MGILLKNVLSKIKNIKLKPISKHININIITFQTKISFEIFIILNIYNKKVNKYGNPKIHILFFDSKTAVESPFEKLIIGL